MVTRMRAPCFLTPLESRELSETANHGRGLFELLAPLGFLSLEFTRAFWSPTGSVTDYSTIYRIIFIFALFGDRYRAPGAIHDHLYSTHEVPRWMADALFLEMCGVVDAEIVCRCWLTRAIGRRWAWCRRHAMWVVLRLLGWTHW